MKSCRKTDSGMISFYGSLCVVSVMLNSERAAHGYDSIILSWSMRISSSVRPQVRR